MSRKSSKRNLRKPPPCPAERKAAEAPPCNAEPRRGRVYIAGKVTGLPMALVIQKFLNAKMDLIAQGYTVVNPIDVVRDAITDDIPWKEIDWQWAMKVTVREMLTCDAIYLLPCWPDSRGAKIEKQLAESLGMNVITA